MKDYGTNTRHLMDALTVMGLRMNGFHFDYEIMEVFDGRKDTGV